MFPYGIPAQETLTAETHDVMIIMFIIIMILVDADAFDDGLHLSSNLTVTTQLS